jgi:hypothetical protein
VRVRSLAILLVLALVAAVGVVAVRELTRPTPPRAVPPIEVEMRPAIREQSAPDRLPRSQSEPAPAPPSDDDTDDDDGGGA